MKIEKNKVVSINYTLKSDSGEVLDSSEGREPLEYIHGMGNLIPGLEKELDGKGAGETLQAVIAPAEAYGEYSDELVQTVSRTQFENPDDIREGAQFQVQTQHDVRIATVTTVEGDNVTLDLNHPLAGETLHFDVDVVSVREASAEELDHGHVHGAHGHHHH